MKKKELKEKLEFYKNCFNKALDEIEEAEERLTISNQANKVLVNTNMNLVQQLEKKDIKISNQSKELNKLLAQKEELQRKLKINNDTICNQIVQSSKLSNIYEGQLDIQDKELDKRLIIIRYLEEKCLKVYDE